MLEEVVSQLAELFPSRFSSCAEEMPAFSTGGLTGVVVGFTVGAVVGFVAGLAVVVWTGT